MSVSLRNRRLAQRPTAVRARGPLYLVENELAIHFRSLTGAATKSSLSW